MQTPVSGQNTTRLQLLPALLISLQTFKSADILAEEAAPTSDKEALPCQDQNSLLIPCFDPAEGGKTAVSPSMESG
jgi:hypothetical protein